MEKAEDILMSYLSVSDMNYIHSLNISETDWEDLDGLYEIYKQSLLKDGKKLSPEDGAEYLWEVIMQDFK